MSSDQLDGPTTLLDAVNTCLRAIGEDEVSTIDGDVQSADVALALGELKTQNETLQSKGWSFNREYTFPISPDASGFINLPSNTLRVDAAYGQDGGLQYRAAQRGLRLYNAKDHTFVFPETLALDMVLKLSWDDLPEPARQYIATAAAFVMQGTLPEDIQVSRILESVVTAKMTVLEQAEDEVAKTNQITGNTSVMNALFGGGVRRKP